jgi:PST family polysaccharide transporter
VVGIFYSAKFIEAVPILRWLSLGAVLQVITWPIGFIVIAKARQKLFFLCETAWAGISLLLSWVCVGSFGLTGAGIAFFGSYVFHGTMMYIVVRRLTGFGWSKENKRILLLYLFLISIVFFCFCWMPFMPALFIGTTAVILSSVYSIRILMNLVSLDKSHPFLRRITNHLRSVVSRAKKSKN